MLLERDGVVTDVGLVEDDDRLRATLPRRRQVAFDASRVEVAI
jgi:hypothetical protein